MKDLSDMSLEELWQLFPISLVNYSEDYPHYYEELSIELTSLSSEYIHRISHIGSTAVDNILSKPIIDILMELKADANLELVKNILTDNNWILMNSSSKRMSFNRGYSRNGYEDRVAHLHLRFSGDNDELYFRDYLLAHPEIAKEYENLKLSLLDKYKFRRDEYTEKKSDFINKHTSLAKLEFRDKYSPPK